MNLLKFPWPADRTPGSIIKNPDYFVYNMNSVARTSSTNTKLLVKVSKAEGDVKCDTDLLEILEVSSVIDLSFFNLRLEIPMWAMYWLIKERPLVNDQGFVGGKKKKWRERGGTVMVVTWTNRGLICWHWQDQNISKNKRITVPSPRRVIEK